MKLEAQNLHLQQQKKRVEKGKIYEGFAPLYFGAIPDPTKDNQHWTHLTGKIVHPILLSRILSTEEIWNLSNAGEYRYSSNFIGCWDLSIGVDTAAITDLS